MKDFRLPDCALKNNGECCPGFLYEAKQLELAGKREVAAWAERDQYLRSNVELVAEIQRLRNALNGIASHELRDWEDFEVIQWMAAKALTP